MKIDFDFALLIAMFVAFIAAVALFFHEQYDRATYYMTVAIFCVAQKILSEVRK